jgi:sialic acid synthase SpsE
VARVALPAGAIITADVVDTLRPATGIAPTLLPAVVGRRLRRAVVAGQILAWDDLA